MKQTHRWHALVALVIVTCMLALPMTAFARKGRDHYNRGLDYEKAQQWEKAAQEFTLALAADPSNVDFQLHYRRAVFNASQMYMQQGRALAEQQDYMGAYNAFRQAFGYDPVNQLAVSEMERMLRLQQVKTGQAVSGNGVNGTNGYGQPPQGQPTRAQEADLQPRPEATRVITFNAVDLKQVIRTLASDLNLNVMFDKQSFAQPRQIDVNLRDVTAAKALDYIFLQENLFFQKLDRRTILVADQSRRPQYQQLVVRTFFISNANPDKVKALISQALPASVGRPQPIVVSDPDTNSLTVRDTAENVKLIGELLESIDKDRAEVVMDVDIYEVNSSDLLKFGNQLGTDATLVNLGGVRAAGAVFNGLTQGALGLPASFGAALILPTSALQAFQSRSNGRLLASTQIHAFNNEESSARIGQRVPVQTAQAYPFGIQTGQNPTNPSGFPTGGFPVINYEPTGLTLNFTPIVFPNLDVQVKMKIESKDVTGASTLTPTFTERTLQGTARVQNNRTMMLASVATEVTANGRQGLPVLGGLPFLGRLFTAPTRDNRRVDIIIAVTPRVLRAPALTPRDEEMRPSGTLQAPTTGSLEAMLRETEREEQIAAARRIPKEVKVQLPDAPVTYEPAKAEANHVVATAPKTDAANTQTVAVQNTSAVVTPVQTAQTESMPVAQQTDVSVPQPKPAAVTNTQTPPVAPATDVASAVKTLVSQGGSVAPATMSAKQDVALKLVDDQPQPKSAPVTEPAPEVETTPNVIELSFNSSGDLKPGEKRQLALQVKSEAPLGMAVITLRFDPKVLKINGISAGSLFAGAKTAPTLTQSIDEKGMALLSLTPAAGSNLKADGALLQLDVEAIAAGDTALAFDLSNVHLVASDGRALLLQIVPVKLTVK